MAKDMMCIEPFHQSILKSSTYLEQFGLNLYQLLMTDDASTFNNTINSFVCIAAVQVRTVCC